MEYARRQLPAAAPDRRHLGIVGVRPDTPVTVVSASGRPYDRPMNVVRPFGAGGQFTM